MKSQRAQFEAVDGSSLRISLSKGKQSLKTTVRHHDHTEGRTKVGCKNYFELTDEAQAEASFTALVRDAEARGWVLVEREHKPKMAFTDIPMAPKLEVSDEVVEQVGKLKSVLRTAKR